MELQEALETRRSVRQYIPREVELEKIKQLIRAASLAPSWKNSQVTRYYVAYGKETLNKVKSALPDFNRKNVQDAPVLIVSTIIPGRSGFEQNGDACNELGNGWGYYDCGLQNMNLLLKATELGLSTLIMGIRDAEKLHEILSIPDSESVVSVIAVGYSDAAPQMPKRFDINDIMHIFND